jgi:hypothetical protein
MTADVKHAPPAWLILIARERRAPPPPQNCRLERLEVRVIEAAENVAGEGVRPDAAFPICRIDSASDSPL